VPADLAGVVVVGPLAFGSVATALGIAEIAAAVGVWNGRAWGRIAGVLVIIVLLAYRVWLSLQRTDRPPAPVDQVGWLLAGLAVPVVASAFVLFVFARRWVPAG
jgi:hypothetical protein